MPPEDLLSPWLWMVITIWFVMALSTVAVIHTIRESGRKWEEEIERVKQRYEERLDEYKKQVDRLEKLLKTNEIMHREEVARLTRINRMLHELSQAVERGAVKLSCPKHLDSEVTLLMDGTIVCGKGHRIWPLPPAPEIVSRVEIERTVESVEETEIGAETGEGFEKG